MRGASASRLRCRASQLRSASPFMDRQMSPHMGSFQKDEPFRKICDLGLSIDPSSQSTKSYTYLPSSTDPANCRPVQSSRATRRSLNRSSLLAAPIESSGPSSVPAAAPSRPRLVQHASAPQSAPGTAFPTSAQPPRSNPPEPRSRSVLRQETKGMRCDSSG